jgi:hypothetical protein
MTMKRSSLAFTDLMSMESRGSSSCAAPSSVNQPIKMKKRYHVPIFDINSPHFLPKSAQEYPTTVMSASSSSSSTKQLFLSSDYFFDEIEN